MDIHIVGTVNWIRMYDTGSCGCFVKDDLITSASLKDSGAIKPQGHVTKI